METTTTTETDGGHFLIIEGFEPLPTNCEDQDCAAMAACEIVTGDFCEFVAYDCKNAGVGSYVPPDFIDSPQDFSFGLYLLDPMDDYGNICSCMKTARNTDAEAEAEATALLESLGVATAHTWCGLGNFYLE